MIICLFSLAEVRQAHDFYFCLSVDLKCCFFVAWWKYFFISFADLFRLFNFKMEQLDTGRDQTNRKYISLVDTHSMDHILM